MLRPSIRIPLTAAVGLPAAAYVLRAALRGWDFSLDLPVDLLLGIMLIVLIGAAWWSRRPTPPDERSHDLPAEVHEENRPESEGR